MRLSRVCALILKQIQRIFNRWNSETNYSAIFLAGNSIEDHMMSEETLMGINDTTPIVLLFERPMAQWKKQITENVSWVVMVIIVECWWDQRSKIACTSSRAMLVKFENNPIFSTLLRRKRFKKINKAHSRALSPPRPIWECTTVFNDPSSWFLDSPWIVCYIHSRLSLLQSISHIRGSFRWYQKRS